MLKVTFDKLVRRVLAVLIVGAAVPAVHAGAFANGTFHALERVVEVARDLKANPTLVPGRDGPLAPSAGGSFDSCADLFPRGAVLDLAKIDPKWRATALCANTFATVYSAKSKTPLVVVERLNKSTFPAKGVSRADQFYPDPRISRAHRAELSDYQGSGYDRGHLAPAADQIDEQSMLQSFSLSNVVPQDPFHNQKIWSKVESDIRKYVRRAKGNVFVYTGPLFAGKTRTIGSNNVWVPSHLYKLVYDEASGRAWAYVHENSRAAQLVAPMKYEEFVETTGWAFLP